MVAGADFGSFNSRYGELNWGNIQIYRYEILTGLPDGYSSLIYEFMNY